MKTILKYKYIISALLVVVIQQLTDLKATLGVDNVWAYALAGVLLFLSMIQERLNRMNADLAKTSRLTVSIEFTVFDGFKKFFSDVMSDFKRENMRKEENILSHLFIGLAVSTLVAFLSIPYFLVTLIINVGASVFLGINIERVQVKFFEGKYSSRDIRWGLYGAMIGNIVFHLLTKYQEQLQIVKPFIFIKIGLLILFSCWAFLSHSSNKYTE